MEPTVDDLAGFADQTHFEIGREYLATRIRLIHLNRPFPICFKNHGQKRLIGALGQRIARHSLAFWIDITDQTILNNRDIER